MRARPTAAAWLALAACTFTCAPGVVDAQPVRVVSAVPPPDADGLTRIAEGGRVDIALALAEGPARATNAAAIDASLTITGDRCEEYIRVTPAEVTFAVGDEDTASNAGAASTSASRLLQNITVVSDDDDIALGGAPVCTLRARLRPRGGIGRGLDGGNGGIGVAGGNIESTLPIARFAVDDDDTAGLSLRQGSVVKAQLGAVTRFYFSLGSEPLADVTVAVSAAVKSTGTCGIALYRGNDRVSEWAGQLPLIVFNASDWQDEREIGVFAQPDSRGAEPPAVRLYLGVASNDTVYAVADREFAVQWSAWDGTTPARFNATEGWRMRQAIETPHLAIAAVAVGITTVLSASLGVAPVFGRLALVVVSLEYPYREAVAADPDVNPLGPALNIVGEQLGQHTLSWQIGAILYNMVILGAYWLIRYLARVIRHDTHPFGALVVPCTFFLPSFAVSASTAMFLAEEAGWLIGMIGVMAVVLCWLYIFVLWKMALRPGAFAAVSVEDHVLTAPAPLRFLLGSHVWAAVSGHEKFVVTHRTCFDPFRSICFDFLLAELSSLFAMSLAVSFAPDPGYLRTTRVVGIGVIQTLLLAALLIRRPYEAAADNVFNAIVTAMLLAVIVLRLAAGGVWVVELCVAAAWCVTVKAVLDFILHNRYQKRRRRQQARAIFDHRDGAMCAPWKRYLTGQEWEDAPDVNLDVGDSHGHPSRDAVVTPVPNDPHNNSLFSSPTRPSSGTRPSAERDVVHIDDVVDASLSMGIQRVGSIHVDDDQAVATQSMRTNGAGAGQGNGQDDLLNPLVGVRTHPADRSLLQVKGGAGGFSGLYSRAQSMTGGVRASITSASVSGGRPWQYSPDSPRQEMLSLSREVSAASPLTAGGGESDATTGAGVPRACSTSLSHATPNSQYTNSPPTVASVALNPLAGPTFAPPLRRNSAKGPAGAGVGAVPVSNTSITPLYLPTHQGGSGGGGGSSGSSKQPTEGGSSSAGVSLPPVSMTPPPSSNVSPPPPQRRLNPSVSRDCLVDTAKPRRATLTKKAGPGVGGVLSLAGSGQQRLGAQLHAPPRKRSDSHTSASDVPLPFLGRASISGLAQTDKILPTARRGAASLTPTPPLAPAENGGLAITPVRDNRDRDRDRATPDTESDASSDPAVRAAVNGLPPLDPLFSVSTAPLDPTPAAAAATAPPTTASPLAARPRRRTISAAGRLRSLSLAGASGPLAGGAGGGGGAPTTPSQAMLMPGGAGGADRSPAVGNQRTPFRIGRHVSFSGTGESPLLGSRSPTGALPPPGFGGSGGGRAGASPAVARTPTDEPQAANGGGGAALNAWDARRMSSLLLDASPSKAGGGGSDRPPRASLIASVASPLPLTTGDAGNGTAAPSTPQPKHMYHSVTEQQSPKRGGNLRQRSVGSSQSPSPVIRPTVSAALGAGSGGVGGGSFSPAPRHSSTSTTAVPLVSTPLTHGSTAAGGQGGGLFGAPPLSFAQAATERHPSLSVPVDTHFSREGSVPL